ncbi:MAG TPA: hypothetical protein VMV95_01570 [Bacillota bacterium]|nr:hypothetical protein [Bacillota bacterium]
MTDKKLTPEQAKRERISVAKATLENIALQGVLGSNQIIKNQALYGQLAVSGAENGYSGYMNTPEVQETRKGLQDQKKSEFDKYCVAGFPSINDGDVSLAIIKQLEGRKTVLPLRDLGEIVKSIAGNHNYDFEVPKELGDYVQSELQMKMQEAQLKAVREGTQIDPTSVLSEKEKDALQVYGLLSEAYNRGVSLSTCDYFSDFNQLGQMIAEKYKPKEKKE